MSTTSLPLRKQICNYAPLVEKMGNFGFINVQPVEQFLQTITLGENYYSNGVVAFKIIRYINGVDELVNSYYITENHFIDELFQVA